MTDQKEMRKLSELRNWKDNPRSIKAKDFERLKKQIQKLGQYKPLLVTPDGEVIGGNMRLKAYQELGVQDVWVSVVNPKDENEKLEYALSDNDRAGFYDEDLLANLVPNYDIEWKDFAVDLREPVNLGELIDKFTPVEEDEVPELTDGEPVSKLGEVYQLGRHRLMCGDSTKVEDVETLLSGAQPAMVFTDPPYGMDAVKNSGVLKEKYRDVIGDNSNDTAIKSFEICQNIPKRVFWGANYYCSVLPPSGCWIVWDKNNGASDQADAELAWTNFKGVVRKYTRASEKFNRVHPTQKPVDLVVWSLKNWGQDGETVLDLFGGSGSTLIGCERTNRICYMMELDPKYCDVIRKRYYKFIGKEDEWQKVDPQ